MRRKKAKKQRHGVCRRICDIAKSIVHGYTPTLEDPVGDAEQPTDAKGPGRPSTGTSVLIRIPQEDLDVVDAIAATETAELRKHPVRGKPKTVTRADVIRRSVAEYLARRK